MKMKNHILGITIVSDSKSDITIYEKLFRKFDVVVDSGFDYDSLDLNSADEIILFDVTTSKQLAYVKEFIKTSDRYIIILSPYTIQHIVSYISNYDGFYISKPILGGIFQKVIAELKLKITKEKFLLRKEDIISNIVDESLVRIAVFDTEGLLVYANNTYLKANHIDMVVEELSFDDMHNCKVNFDEIKYNLLKYNRYTSEQQQGTVWYKSHFYFIKGQKYIVHFCSDVTDVQSQLEALKKEALFFKQTNEGVIITDEKGVIESVNTSFCKITGYTKDEVLGKPTSILSSGMHTKDFYEHMWDSLTFHGMWQGEIWNRRKNGEVYPEWLSISRSKNERGKIHYLALFTDISSIKEADKKIKFYANHDHLTGLVNKSQFENMLKHAIESSKRHNRKFALMFLDLDHFKEVNDTYGHNIGDILLKTVASRFTNTLRKEDIIARIGGDEFNIILENIESADDAITIAQKLSQSIREPIIIEGHQCIVSLSIGIAIFPEHGNNEVDLIKNADAAMYEVKNSGRDGVIVYESKFTEKLMQRVYLQNELKQAIDDENIDIYFQPVIDRSGNLSGAEILARWEHPTEGFISPETFIKIAEKNGSIIPLGKIILKKAFEAIQKISLLSLPKNSSFKFAINLSAKEFFDKGYLDNLRELLNDFVINPSIIELEITETHIMQNHQLAVKKLEEIKDEGFSIAIDDFGTGYSSLNYLKLFPIDKLKIDKSFVLDFLENEDDRAIINSVIQLARIFKLKVQAEGVESEIHMTNLKDMDCDFFQGYHYSKPLNFNSFIEFIEGYNNAK